MIKQIHEWNEESKSFTVTEVEMSQTEIDEMNLDREENLYVNNIEYFSQFRISCFAKWDILKTNVSVGLEDPLTEVEIQWYRDMLDFPTVITKDTKLEDYPITPDRLK